MRQRLPEHLHYPITVTKIKKRVGDKVNLRDALFAYSYITQVKYGDRYDPDAETIVDKSFVTNLESSLEGNVKLWLIWEGDVITGPRDIVEVEEECSHATQYAGMCTNCGKDMEALKAEGDLGTSRTSIQAAHDTDKLLINQEEANQVNEETQKRLLAARKLSLVVDLDQTVIHAAVEPTIGEWQKDPTNPNYEAVKDVGSFQLKDDGPGQRGCTYYIKSRPGLQKFLETISQKYEMHIYTMGTRAYAEQVAKLIDPDGKYFESRILSRDESGSMIAKNLTRIFPVDTKMVVIIDDRADVWKWSPNLLRVTAFDFFVGIGDINAGFLPKKQELPPPPSPIQPAQLTINGDSKDDDDQTATEDEQALPVDTSALERVVEMSSADSVALQELQKKAREEDINSQIESKPLAKLQQELDEMDGVEPTSALSPISTLSSETTTTADPVASPSTAPTSPEIATTTPESSPTTPPLSEPPRSPTRVRHSVLKNDDDELIYLQKSLEAVHQKFFNEYGKKRHTPKGGRVSALTGKRKAPLPDPDEEDDSGTKRVIPDIKKIMPSMKEKVLSEVTIVFSGVLPLGTDIYRADISLWAQSFGARIAERIDNSVTHVIAARIGTAKVKSAVKRGIKVVSVDWLIKSMQQWKKLEEWKFLLADIGQKHEEMGNYGPSPEEIEAKSLRVVDSYLLSSEEESASGLEDVEEDDLAEESEARGRKRLKLDLDISRNSAPSAANNENGGDEEGDEEGDVTPGSPDLSKDEWNEIDEELKEFMGSDFEDSEASDAESIRSDVSLSVRGKRKRPSGGTGGGGGGGTESDGDAGGGVNGIDSRPRKRTAAGKKASSGLREVSRVDSGENTPATDDDSGPTPDLKLTRQKTQAEYDADLALKLEAALEEDFED